LEYENTAKRTTFTDNYQKWSFLNS